MKRAAAVILLVLLATSAGAAKITYVDMLDKMTDMKQLATLPQPGETCQQFSSYDRRSVAPDKPNWGANGDAGNFLREDPEGMVLADMDGPGCIFRIWSANPEGILKVFIDRQKEPVLKCGFQDIVYGKVPPFLGPVVGRRTGGANLYFPIPYQKHCRVVVEKPKRMYHHVTYRTYPKGTQVESFHLPLRAQELAKLKNVISQLEGRGRPPWELRGEVLGDHLSGDWRTFTLAPGETFREEAENDGPPVAIRAMRFRFLNLPEDLKARRKMLARTILRFYWDNETTPSVDVPIGDFFGTAPGMNSYKSLPLGIAEDGTAYCYWYMPYKKAIRYEFENQGDKTVTFEATALFEQCEIPPDQIAYFHAKWHRDYPNKTFDWPFLECTGRGRFCGAVLTIWNPVRGWWGEGDEKFWVDGEDFPSTFGTGSEDYFGYAWCGTALFHHAFHNQTLCEGPGNGNYTSVNRWQIADNIPFQKSFKGTMENYGNDKDYSCVTYWYAGPNQKDFFKPVNVRDRVIQEPRKPFRIKGAIEGETLKIVGKSDDMETGPQDISGFGEFSNALQMWLRGKKVGSWAELALPQVAPGAYKMTIFPVTSWDYALVQISVNGKKFGEPYDAYTSNALRGKQIVLDRVLLKGRDDVLRADMVGKNDKSTGYFFGIDAIKLEKLK
ncbi:DUF2961 domain-containing protein [bacterium]|nr:DUF2961 domain-containing protein [bacterium]